jgi:hypothetical protein
MSLPFPVAIKILNYGSYYSDCCGLHSACRRIRISRSSQKAKASLSEPCRRPRTPLPRDAVSSQNEPCQREKSFLSTSRSFPPQIAISLYAILIRKFVLTCCYSIETRLLRQLHTPACADHPSQRLSGSGELFPILLNPFYCHCQDILIASVYSSCCC